VRRRHPFPLSRWWFLAVALLAGAAACGEVGVEEAQVVGQTLCLADFESCINPIFDAALHSSSDAVTCSDGGCHDRDSGSGGAFKIVPDAAPASPEMEINFYTAKSFANLSDPSLSKLLLEPLRGSFGITGSHTGGDIFPDTADPCYQAIRAWIANGVEAEESPACGQCIPIDPAICGF